MEYLQPRFPSIPSKAPHYESIYLTAAHPSNGTTYWIRHTIRKEPGKEPVGSLWFTKFTPDGPRAGKVNAPPGSSKERPIAVGDHGWVSRDGATGSLSVPGLEASWELSFSGAEEPMSHLPKPWLYSAPVPRTKSTSPRPDTTVNGRIVVDGEESVLQNWRGMLGHNWGSEHAHRWVWLRGAGFAEDPDAWLDVVIGRIKVGPVTSPWIANGMLSLGGIRRRVGGLGKKAVVSTRPDGVDVRSTGIQLRVQAPIARSAGWEYADPSGELHQVRNCSNAGMALEVDGRTLTTTYGAVYELGTPETDPAVVMQPFPDR
ncbi:MAG TPA: hypothetical protein VLI04_10475 [Nocardioidaceae bacterium]|nr:hypothetical protein [Nocardioidaceae bacterium]